jgi:sugar lactone lactonase YvrE
MTVGCDGLGPETAPPPSPHPGPTVSPAESPPEAEPDPDRPIVWVAAEDAGELAEVDVEEGRVLRSVDVPGHPHNLTVRGDTVAATLQRAGTLVLVRGDRVRTVELGGSPHDVKTVGNQFVVANEGAARLDLISGEGEQLGSVSLRANPHDVAVSPDGRTAWASLNGDDALAVVDLRGQEVRRYVPTGERPHDLLFAPDGRLWVTDWDHGIHVFSRRGEHIHTIGIGEEPHHLTFTPDGQEAWITDHGADAVHVISTETFDVLDELRVDAPHHVAVTPDGRRAPRGPPRARAPRRPAPPRPPHGDPAELVREIRAAGGKVPGFGHPVHRPVDPRAERILELADARGVSGPHTALARQLRDAVAEVWGQPQTMNVSMSIAAVMLDLGFPSPAVKALPILARTAGLLAHLAEEQQQPLGFLMARVAEEAIEYER